MTPINLVFYEKEKEDVSQVIFFLKVLVEECVKDSCYSLSTPYSIYI